MVTMLMAALGEHKPVLERSVVALFIAGEEGAEAGVGVDMVVNAGMYFNTRPVFRITQKKACRWVVLLLIVPLRQDDGSPVHHHTHLPRSLGCTLPFPDLC